MLCLNYLQARICIHYRKRISERMLLGREFNLRSDFIKLCYQARQIASLFVEEPCGSVAEFLTWD